MNFRIGFLTNSPIRSFRPMESLIQKLKGLSETQKTYGVVLPFQGIITYGSYVLLQKLFPLKTELVESSKQNSSIGNSQAFNEAMSGMSFNTPKVLVTSDTTENKIKFYGILPLSVVIGAVGGYLLQWKLK